MGGCREAGKRGCGRGNVCLKFSPAIGKLLHLIMNEKERAALEAVRYIQPGIIVGLGTGSTANYATQAIGNIVQQGLQIQGVPTSEATRTLATSLNIPLAGIDSISKIDVTIDGADEFTTSFELIKGGGGALFREKVIASLTQLQIIVTDSSKKVERLGRFKVPVEVIPFALNYVKQQLNHLSGTARVRHQEGLPFRTDQNNFILDVDFGLIDDPAGLAEKLDGITGIAEHGLFIGLTQKIIMARGDEIITLDKN